MKKGLLIGIVLVAFVVFAGGAMAQEKKAEPAAPAAPKAAAPAPEKAKAPKDMKAAGTVSVYEAGKMITVKADKGKEMTFDVTGKTKMTGEVKQGAKVTVMYKKDGEKMVATSIAGPKPKKETPPPKAK